MILRCWPTSSALCIRSRARPVFWALRGWRSWLMRVRIFWGCCAMASWSRSHTLFQGCWNFWMVCAASSAILRVMVTKPETQKQIAAEPAVKPQPVAQAASTKTSESAKAVTSAAESTLRVDITVLNKMINLVGELVLTRNQVLQATASDPKMTLLSRRLDMVTADLRESVLKARMQPVSNIFSKMPRIVGDVSQLLGRKVRLEMEGQETELDKSLLEAIKDPLTHAVRNALDHGIEPPDVRQAAGKDPEGTLRLRAMQEGSHVVIEVSDDGAGMGGEGV